MMLLPPVMATVGTTPCVFWNGSAGTMSGLFAFAVRAAGVALLVLCEKLKPASLKMVGLIVLMKWMVALRPGELVLVMAPFGIAEPVNRPPGSVVGIWSISNLPQSVKRSLKLWSRRAMY